MPVSHFISIWRMCFSTTPYFLFIRFLRSISSVCVRLCVYERQTKLNYGLWNSDGECQCQNDVQLFKWIVNLAMRFVQINGWTHIHLLHITIDVVCFHRVFVCVIFNSIQFIWQLKLLPSIPSSANISLNLNRAWMDRKEESGECVRVK